MEHPQDLVLLVDGKVVRVGRGNFPNAAHDEAHLLTRILKLSRIDRLHLDLIIRIMRKLRNEFADGNDRLIIHARAIEKTAYSVQDSDNLKRTRTDHDGVPDRRFARKKVCGDV